MQTLSSFINEGVNYNATLDTFVFDFDKDSHKDDVIKMQTPLYSVIGDGLIDVYHFAYIPEQASIDSKVYNKFLNYIKGQDIRKNTDIFNFVKFGIRKFVTDSRIKIYDVGVIVYPESRSNINNAIVHQIHKSTSTTVQSFEIIKNLAKNIEFDFESFKRNEFTSNHSAKDRQILLNNAQQLLDKNRQLEYFSIASACKSKYKQYFMNYLKFKSDEEKQRFTQLANKDILIIDDVTTTGSTIKEICRMIRALGIDSKITVFTLIGNINI